MIEFFQNIGQWVMIHKDEIVVFLTSSQFIALTANIVSWIKTNKKTKENTTSTNALTVALGKNDTLNTRSEEIKNDTTEIIALQKTLSDFCSSMDNKMVSTMGLLAEKLNAMLEVQSIVYSTIKDEKVRSTVNSILTNAKYAETATRAELQRQVEELRAMVASKTSELNAVVNKTVQDVVAVVAGDKPEEESDTVERY